VDDIAAVVRGKIVGAALQQPDAGRDLLRGQTVVERSLSRQAAAEDETKQQETQHGTSGWRGQARQTSLICSTGVALVKLGRSPMIRSACGAKACWKASWLSNSRCPTATNGAGSPGAPPARPWSTAMPLQAAPRHSRTSAMWVSQ